MVRQFLTPSLAAIASFGPAAHAQSSSSLSEFERPFGFVRGEEDRPFDPGTRDVNGNRLVVDGRIVSSSDLGVFSQSTLSSGAGALAGAGFGQTTAIGNQLNVVTQGSFNTVVIDSTQINNGDQTAILNGEIDLDE